MDTAALESDFRFRLEARHGTIAESMAADFVVLSADPSGDIRHTRHLVTTYRGGKAFPPALTTGAAARDRRRLITCRCAARDDMHVTALPHAATS